MSVQTILEEIRTLSLEERKELMKLIVDTLTEPLKKKHSLREFRGLGAHAYDGTDAQEHLNQLRSEWGS